MTTTEYPILETTRDAVEHSVSTTTPQDGQRSPAAPARRRILRRLSGRPNDPAWVRPALLVLLAATAVMYLWDLEASGWANSFYSAAVQAGSTSWKSFFFGSFDASNFITVDKPPAALWLMEISVRIFGLNPWSILVPQALEGVATVWLAYATVRRWFSAGAGLTAGAVLALTPVAALMFRYNNPDALLVMLLTAASYATARAIEKSSPRWLIVAGALVGFGFITKMLQAFLVVPAFGLAYLLCADTRLRRRILHLVYAAVALVVSSGWWVLAVQLTPKADRPYVGGSTNDSELGLIFGYNGFGRITGDETGSVSAGGASPWGPTGITRLFTDTFGGQISWLLPAALILMAGGFWYTRNAPRTDKTRAALIIFGGWMLLSGVVFSFAKGIIHPYYSVALAPAIAGVVAVGTFEMWRHRDAILSRILLGASAAVTAAWSYVLLERSPDWLAGLRYVVLIVGLAASVLIVLTGLERSLKSRALLTGSVVLAAAASIAGPLAYTIDTVATPHTGSIPSAGPTLTGSTGGPGGGPRAGGAGGLRPGGTAPGSGAGGFSFPGSANTPGSASSTGGPAAFSRGSAPTASRGNGGAGGIPGGAGGGAGFLNSIAPGKEITGLLEQDDSKYTWVAAVVGADAASGYQLATDHAVMAIGGFNGTDPAPTLAGFEKDVRDGEIHYFIATSGPGSGGSSTSASQITSWVESHYSAKTVDGTTIYDLSGS
jgi:4-amino-4-deoxy-L-arabinose transferase-like glycosyltransferase